MEKFVYLLSKGLAEGLGLGGVLFLLTWLTDFEVIVRF